MELKYNTQSEKAIIGICIESPEHLEIALEKISPIMFYDERNKNIFTGLFKMLTENKKIAYDTVLSEGIIKPEEWMDGTEYYSSPATLETHVDNILKCYQEREVEKIFQIGLNHIKNEDFNQKVMDFAINKIENLYLGVEQKYDIDLILNNLVERWELGKKDGYNGYDWGFEDLNKYTRGIERGKCFVIGALKKSGKTRFISCIMKKLLEQNVNVLFLSLEMDRHDIVEFMICNECMINTDVVGTKYMSREDIEKAENVLYKIKKLPLIIEDCKMDRNILRAKIKHHVRKNNIQIVFIDFFQLIEYSEENERIAYDRHAKMIKDLKKELNIPFVVLSQLTNASEGKNEPGIGDLKGTGGIAELADCVILLKNISRQENKKHYEKRDMQDFELTIGGQRFGASNITIKMKAQLQYCHFFEEL